MKRIVLAEGGGGGTSWALPEGGVVLIGSGDDVGIQIEDDSLSVHHAEIGEDTVGVRIRDLGAPSGTFVNGTRIVDAYLAQGDRIQLGRVLVVFDAGESLMGLSGRMLPGSNDYELMKTELESGGDSDDLSMTDIPVPASLAEVSVDHRRSELDSEIKQRMRALEGIERIIEKRSQELSGLKGESGQTFQNREEPPLGVSPVESEEGISPSEKIEEIQLDLPETVEELERMEGTLIDEIEEMIPKGFNSRGPSSSRGVQLRFDHALDVLDFASPNEYECNPWSADPSGRFPVPPVGCYGLALASGGQVFFTTASARRSLQPIVVMGDRDWPRALRSVLELKNDGRKVFFGWSGRGKLSAAKAISSGKAFQVLREGMKYCDGVICDRREDVDVFSQFSGAVPVHHWGVPCPVDRQEWNFAVPLESRSGMIVTTPLGAEFREEVARYLSLFFDIASFASETVTLMAGAENCPWIEEVVAFTGAKVRVIDLPTNYEGYLKEVAGHRLMLSLEEPSGGGCHALDALLCRNVCLSAKGAGLPWLEFPDLPQVDHRQEVADLVVRYLQDDLFHHSSAELAIQKAQEACSFGVTRAAISGVVSGVKAENVESVG